MAKFIGQTGLVYLWGKIKTWVGNYVKITSSTGKDTITAGNNSVDIYDWAQASTKPSYTAAEVGALPEDTAIPDELSDLSDDSTHRLVTDTEKSTWNGKQDAIDSSHKLSADLIEDGTTNKAYTATEKTKLSGIASGAEVNQNAFSNVKVGSTTVAADAKTDTVELAPASNSLISITGDATNDKVTFDVDKDLSKYDNTNAGFITQSDIPEGVQPYTSDPAMNGTASAGSSEKFSRGDHVHPVDTSRAAASHTHGNVTNDGKLQTSDVTIANGDKLVITDSSDGNKIARASVSFDGSTATKALTQKGTFENFNNYSHPTATAAAAAAVKVGNDGLGHVVLGDALGKADVGLGNVENKSSATIRGEMTSSNVTDALGYTPVNSSNVGAANGICPLDANSKIDSQYLPSYVDDVVEAYIRSGQTALSSAWLATGSASGTAITPEAGKIYVLMNSSSDYPENTQFRWGGTSYVKLNDGGISELTTAEMDTATSNWA